MLERLSSLDPENIEKFINRGTKRVEEGEEATPEMIAEVQKSREKRYAKLNRAEDRQRTENEKRRKETERDLTMVGIISLFQRYEYAGDPKRLANELRERLTLSAKLDLEKTRADAKSWKERALSDLFRAQDLKKKAEIQWDLWDEFDQISERQKTKGLSRAEFVDGRVAELITEGKLDATEAETFPIITGDRKKTFLASPAALDKDIERDKVFLDVMDEFLAEKPQEEKG